ncbi:unnamed protein product, partial [Rotaria sp. Silwood1]
MFGRSLNLAEFLLDKNDFVMAETWFNRACESGSVLAQMKRTDFETTLREKKQLMASFPSNIVPMVNAMKNVWDSLKTSKSIYELSKEQSKYDYDVLSKYANQGSRTAQRLCNALEHFYIALTILIESDMLTEQQEDTLVHELSECYRLEDIVAQFPNLKTREKVGKIVDQVLRRCKAMPGYPASQLDEDARICYASLHMDSHELIDEFLNSCKQKYPKSIYFFELSTSINGWLERYDAVVYNANAGLELDPTNSELLIDKAVAWRQLENHNKEAVETYKSFLAVAPKDHRKVPDAYYSMAMCYLALQTHDGLDVSKKMYEQGKEAEKLQLPCFLPYESSSRKLLEFLNDDNILSLIKTKATPEAVASVVNHKARLTDPHRIEVIKLHRKCEADIIEHTKNPGICIPVQQLL